MSNLIYQKIINCNDLRRTNKSPMNCTKSVSFINQSLNCLIAIKIIKMRQFAKLSVLLVVAVLSCTLVDGRSISGENKEFRSNFEQLDDEGKFLLAWSISGDVITFEIEAHTTGWVGFGISPQGNMVGADIFIGGVQPNGRPYGEDRFGVGQTEPKLDDHNDWTLLQAIELPGSGKTIIKVSRKLNTCDDEDYPIGNDTSRLIWAMGSTDDVSYHGASSRGTRSTNLLHADEPEVDLTKAEKFEMILEMEMPSQDTSYWCSFHKGPALDKKHQIIGFGALLETLDSLKHTHHFILYNCYVPPGSDQTMDEIFGDYTVDKGVMGDHCYESVTTLPIGNCAEYLYVWSKGGKDMILPDNAGYPIGETLGNQYYMLEIHYDNPEKLEGITFPSGVQFYYTDEIREHDAGLLTLGHDVAVTMTIPPNQPAFKVVGHCMPKCMEKITGDNEEGITVFNSLLHSHLSGKKIKTRHFRENEELPWLDFDDHYDFDYQQNKNLFTPIKVLKTDQLTVECIYDSTWKNGEIVSGGLSTREEMCEAILMYYPRQDLDVCGSEYPEEKHFEEFGITNYTEEMTNTLTKYHIVLPEELAGEYENSMSFKFNWTEEFLREYAERHQNGEHVGDCISRKTGEMYNFPAGYPENFVPYVPEDMCSA